MRIRIIVLVPVGFLCWAGLYLIDAFREMPARPVLPVVPANDSTFVIIGDTQAPLWPETFVLDENGNEVAREILLRDILARNPGAVFHAGDLVAFGFNQSHWPPIDRFTDSLSGKGIPFFPVPGNHEYMLFGSRGIGNFRGRFPFARETGYAVRVGRLAVVLVNSNFGKLGQEQVKAQRTWYDSTMAVLEQDSSISGIIVVCHHAPFTNSTIVDPSVEVQNRFVPALIAATKGKAFITGHCHAIEHFVVGGKHFIVSGGGGGLQQPLLLGGPRRRKDLFPEQTETRMFHYLEGHIRAEGVTLTVRMLEGERQRIEIPYAVTLLW